MEVEVNEETLKSAGAEILPDGRRGLRIHGWEIESLRGSILNSLALQQWEEKLQTSHLPEMVFGDNALVLKHIKSDTKIHFNAFDALIGWKQEGLPPVEVPAAAQWKFRSKPSQQVILDYDYTFTTPYSGSEVISKGEEQQGADADLDGETGLRWEKCEERIDLAALSLKEPILFYDEVVLYEDELADNGVSLLTVKVRVMPTSWFLLLRFWLRVDGVLMRLRDTRMHCVFDKGETRECIASLTRARHPLFSAKAVGENPRFSLNLRKGIQWIHQCIVTRAESARGFPWLSRRLKR